MAGTKAGGLKAALKNREKYGDNFYSEIGKKGGSAATSKLKGFAADPLLARAAGAKGGRNSKRGKSRTTKKVMIRGIEMTQIIVRKITTPAQKVRVHYGR